MNINDWVMSGLGRCDQGILRRVAPLDDGRVAVAPKNLLPNGTVSPHLQLIDEYKLFGYGRA